jgi:hypothetical protein
MVLAGASDAEELELPAHGSARLKVEIRPVHPLVAVMTAGAVKAGANPRDAVASLEEKSGESLGQVGTQLKIPDPDMHFAVKILNETAVPDRDRFLRVVIARRVTAAFSVDCTGGTVRGELTTWAKVPMTATIQCGITKRLDQAGREAERRACAA